MPAVAGFHARLAVLHELEHAHEVLERGPLVAVREARVHVGQAALDRGLGAGVIDGRHESLLLTREHRRITGIVGPDPVGSQLTQRIEVVVHPSLPVAWSSSRIRILARLRRERTVPTGTPSAAAISS